MFMDLIQVFFIGFISISLVAIVVGGIKRVFKVDGETMLVLFWITSIVVLFCLIVGFMLGILLEIPAALRLWAAG